MGGREHQHHFTTFTVWSASYSKVSLISPERMQVDKASSLAEMNRLLADLSSATQALTESRCELEDTLTRLAAAGYVDVCSTSSSSSSCDDTAQAKVWQGQEGIQRVLAHTQGAVMVCGGKSCSRKQADQVHGLLAAQRSSMPGAVSVQRCSCLGICKQSVNVKVESPSAESYIASGVTLQQLQEGLGAVQDSPPASEDEWTSAVPA